MAMIPYVELVSGLTNWRVRQGLATGASDYLGEAPQHGLGLGLTTAPAEYAPGEQLDPAAEYIEEFSDMDIVAEEDVAPGFDDGDGDASYEAAEEAAPAYDDDSYQPVEDQVIEEQSYEDDAHRAATVDAATFDDPAYDSEPPAFEADDSGVSDEEATVIGENPGAPAVAPAMEAAEFEPMPYDEDDQITPAPSGSVEVGDIGGMGEGFDAEMSEGTLDVGADEIEEEYAMDLAEDPSGDLSDDLSGDLSDDDGGATMIHDEPGAAPPPLAPPPLADSDDDDDDDDPLA